MLKRALLWCFALSACGGDPTGSGKHHRPDVVAVSLVAPSPFGACAQSADIASSLEVVLRMGNTPNSLDLHLQGLDGAQGLADVSTSANVPVLLAYFYNDQPTHAQLVPLLYRVGVVELCDDDIETSVSMSFEDGLLIDTNDVLDSLPDDWSPGLSCDTDLDRASAWARGILETYDDLDLDDDGLSNAQEACAGTLF